MLGDQGFRVRGSSVQGGQGGLVSDVAERDTDIAQQATAFGTKEWRASKTAFEFGLIDREQLKELWSGQVRSRMGLHQRTVSGKAIPGTDGQAIVASKDAIANGGPQRDGDGSLQ